LNLEVDYFTLIGKCTLFLSQMADPYPQVKRSAPNVSAHKVWGQSFF